MIVLDTNVVSEPIRARPDDRVLAWLAAQRDTAVTAVTVGELLVGVGALPAGRRRDGLTAAVEDVLVGLGSRVLGYGTDAAREYAAIREVCRRRGRPIGTEDGMIAGIVRSHGAVLATRNTRDFVDLGIELVDPWAQRP